MDVKLLDCTLRDGGYVNDWNFGNSIIRYMLQRYINSNIEYIEIGFLDERRPADINRSIFPNTAVPEEIFKGIDKKDTKLVAMIDYGTCGVTNLSEKTDSIIDGIRIIFKKHNFYNAIEFAKEIIAKGYFVSLNMVSITSYNDQDVLDFCNAVNEISPYAVAIVDTYGLMHKEQMAHYFELLDHNLNEKIAIGYHSHNNFQLAYSNSISILDSRSERTIILDGTAYGMGKSAGNTPIELLAMHLNEFYKKNYDISQILEIIETAVMPIYKNTPWGYSLLYYLAALNNCHPNYVSFLLGKYTLSVQSINDILKMLKSEEKLSFNEIYIQELYDEYRNKKIDDTATVQELKKKYNNKDILLMGPGKSVSTEETKIIKFITEKAPVVISINFIPKNIAIDALFIGNPKRYGSMASEVTELAAPVIATSNIECLERQFEYCIDCTRLLDESDLISDNSLAMALNLLEMVEVRTITLAGVDGYKLENANDLYCEESFNLSSDYGRLMEVNKQLGRKIALMKDKLHISFLTDSIYERA